MDGLDSRDIVRHGGGIVFEQTKGDIKDVTFVRNELDEGGAVSGVGPQMGREGRVSWVRGGYSGYRRREG